MLITFSGVVGSGKTTSARQTAARLREDGYDAEYVQFHFLPCFQWFRLAHYMALLRGRQARPATDAADGKFRRSNYRQRKLTLAPALGYLVKVISYRLYSRWRWPRGKILVLDRYFYDVFTHYLLRSAAERRYVAALCRCIPTPDLAVLLVASPQSIAARRDTYDDGYLSAVSSQYAAVRDLLPPMITMRTDDATPVIDRTVELICAGGPARSPHQAAEARPPSDQP